MLKKFSKWLAKMFLFDVCTSFSQSLGNHSIILYLCILNSTRTNHTEFWQILKERTKYDWSTDTNEINLLWVLFSVNLEQQFLVWWCCFITFTCDLKIIRLNYAETFELCKCKITSKNSYQLVSVWSKVEQNWPMVFQ